MPFLLVFLFAVARTSVAPLLAERERIVHSVVDAQLTPVAMPLPNFNTVAFPGANPLPLIVTGVAPALGPALGLTVAMVGFSYLN